ncbi:hypothetical protein [Zooshikella sp. RANM57]|uniref:hypothetical protein n=1 Tax=Zooshikella sp. RANM57 TaxID=3425863 RepID=UPI003D6F8027
MLVINQLVMIPSRCVFVVMEDKYFLSTRLLFLLVRYTKKNHIRIEWKLFYQHPIFLLFETNYRIRHNDATISHEFAVADGVSE